MKPNNFLILIVFGFLLACGPIALPGVSETKPQQASSPPTVQLASQPTEKITNSGSSPVATPNSPIATPTPERSVDKEAREETSKSNIPGDAAVIVHRGGGFAGVDERWIIYLEGQIEGPSGEQRQVEPEQVQALLETIQAAGFFDLNDSYVPLDTCCDRFTYAITVQLGGQTKTVRTIDASPTQPEQLTTIMKAIEELLFTSE